MVVHLTEPAWMDLVMMRARKKEFCGSFFFQLVLLGGSWSGELPTFPELVMGYSFTLVVAVSCYSDMPFFVRIVATFGPSG